MIYRFINIKQYDKNYILKEKTGIASSYSLIEKIEISYF